MRWLKLKICIEESGGRYELSVLELGAKGKLEILLNYSKLMAGFG